MTIPEGKPESAGFGRISDGADMAVSEPVSTSKKDLAKKVFSMEEVEKHNTEHDVWIVVNDKVYDCTEYLELHPGGIDSILINGGADATEDFVAIHSSKATKMLEKFYIGDLDVSSVKTSTAAEVKDAIDIKTGRPIALDPKRKRPFKLQEKIVLSEDSFLLDFALPSPEHILGLPTGKHMFLSAEVNGEAVMRRYTPISSNHDIGRVQFVIKAYRPCTPFPNGGKFSQHLDSIKVGDTIDMRGPVGEFEYVANGKYYIDGLEHFANCFNMIAGGTGITPVMQVASEILRHPEDKTKLSLVFACRTEGDLLMRSTLDAWAETHSDKFKVHYVLSAGAPAGWKHSTGFVNKDIFEKELYPAGDDVHTLMCGPPIMLEKACVPNLAALGHKDSRMFAF